jgi:phage terminase large subunit-like protein
MLEMEEILYDVHGNEVGADPIYEVFERVLEDSPNRDGTGQYLWPRARRNDGKFFGFDIKERAKKYAKYLDKAQFFAQYYNDPTDPMNMRLDSDLFQYYDPVFLKLHDGVWYIKDKRINILSGIDFAFSEAKRADYTAIVVCGIDDGNIYVLDIDRFKTNRVSVVFQHLLDMHKKWFFRRLLAETVSGQEMVVQELKQYMTEYGIFFSIDEQKPTRHEGSKEERIALSLVPRYEAHAIWHYRGGNCQILEDELVHEKPEHDDIADILAQVVPNLRAPSRARFTRREQTLSYNNRFGGIH